MPQVSHPLMFPLAAMNYLGSLNALQHWSDASLGLKPHPEPTAAPLPTLAPELKKAVEQEAHQRFYRWLAGIERYLAAPAQKRPSISGEVVARFGASRLYRYASAFADAPPLLVIPSLINRAYILDFSPRQSFMRHLARHCGPAYLLDWAEPQEEATPLSIADYITQQLEPAMAQLASIHRQPPILVGYCMGGLFAIAAAARKPELVGGLALLATPWNFHAAETPSPLQPPADCWQQAVPHAAIHHWFSLQRPWSIQAKFARFAEMRPGSAQAREFLQIEQWLQDGKDMSGPAAYTCFVEWAVQNTPLRGHWQVGGETIRPEHIKTPVFLGIPERDGIVPPAASDPLIHAWPHAHIHRMEAGHVSMIAGLHARQQLWQPLTRWLEQVYAV